MTHTEHNFENNYLPHRPRVLQLCRQLLGDAAAGEDACQEIYIKLWEQRYKLAEVLQPLPFLIRLARNHCLDKLRVATVPHLSLEEALLSQDIGSDERDKQQEEEILDKVECWSQSLPEPQRTIFTLVHYEGVRVSEVASRLDLTEVNVRVILSRLRKQIKAKLQDE